MMQNLDLKDRKILYELDVHSRQSYQKIAKMVGLSKDAVMYRIKKLQEEGIIKRFHTVLDVGKLGFISFRLYVKLHNATPEKEQEIIDFFKKRKDVTWLVSIDGEYNLGMWVLVKSIKEMNVLWKEFLKNYLNYVEKRWLTIFTKVSYFPRTYLLDKKQNDDEYVFITEPEECKVSEVNREILKLLAPNARMPIFEIARKLKITPKTVIAHMKQLEKDKIIVGYRTMFDLEKLGYQYFKVHFNLQNVTEQKEKKFRMYIKQHSNIVYDDEVLGGDDIEIEIQVRSLPELRKIIEEMKSHFNDIIRDYKYFLFYEEHKFVFLPM